MKLSKGFIFTILASISWALVITTNKLILNNSENGYNLIFWTTILAIPYWVYGLYKNKTEAKQLNKRAIIILLLGGLISAVGIKVIETFAIKYSQSINYSFLIRTTVIFTVLLEFIFFKNPITKRKIIMSVVILLGTYFFVAQGKSIELSLGDTLTLTEAFFISLGNYILGKYATNMMSSKLSAVGNFFFGLIPLIILCIFAGIISIPKDPLLVILATIFSIALAVLRFKAYKESSVSFVSMVFSVTPIFVTLIAVVLLGETISLIQILGGILIVGAVLVVEKLKI